MATINSNGYKIYLGKDVFRSLNTFLSRHSYSSCFILCDENTLQHCLPLLISSCPTLSSSEILEIESGEASKSLEISAYLWQTLLENAASRSTLLVNLGGGVVSDLGGFTASLYKRGIDFIHIPTSLLAMADASVGGKTGIDFNQVKNSIGTFAQPKAVFIHPGFLQSLPERHVKNGLAEVYKMALIADKTLWKDLQKKPSAGSLIRKSVVLKNKIVLKDPMDKGLRNILNFGHSLGHALEALLLGTQAELLHGEAIVAGMLMESHIAWQKKMISKETLNEIVSVFHSSFPLPSLSQVSPEEMLRLLKNDKKASRNQFVFSLISGIGSCKFGVPASEKQIKKSLDYYSSLFA